MLSSLPSSFRLAVLAVTMTVLTSVAADAMDDYISASSSAPAAIALCSRGEPLTPAACKAAGYDKLIGQIDRAFESAQAKAPANVRPLLKRDQAWFNEIIVSAGDSVPQSDDIEERKSFGETLSRRVTTLQGIADGFGRAGFSGRWVNTFGSVVVTSAERGAYRLAIDTRAVYGSGSELRRQCKVSAVVKPGSGAWLTGTILPDEDQPAKTSGDGTQAADAKSAPAKPPSIKIRRQGETLRVVVARDAEWRENDRPHCEYMWQITASYFATGKPDAMDKTDTAFTAPTFDCTHPETAADEEICADPDLADNDQRLNRAWKALQPRLDPATRRALMDDQRGWVHAQSYQYPEFLHPAWEKQTSFMHFTTDARDRLDALQRERIALLEGFDEKRSGLTGVWLAYNAILKVTANDDGSLTGEGWKWEQGDWKAGCDYAINGKLVGGVFRADDQGINPDTLERDHAMLMVNRQDDAFAKKRTQNVNVDEAKCKRTQSASSSARLFPARASPDINDFGNSIR
jgi:uncharacterized protein YecT (DUF1311 family)